MTPRVPHPKKPANRLPGHTLHNEGRVQRGYTYLSEGQGVCECGERSPVLGSDNQRKAWHREHKESVRRTEAFKRIQSRMDGRLRD